MLYFSILLEIVIHGEQVVCIAVDDARGTASEYRPDVSAKLLVSKFISCVSYHIVDTSIWAYDNTLVSVNRRGADPG